MEHAHWRLCRTFASRFRTIDWPESLKEMQRNWIGKSIGASVRFPVDGHDEVLEVFTTRPDTLFGVTFMTLAPELELVQKITTPEQKEAVDAYVASTAQRSERDRMADVKTISGAFTGAYALHLNPRKSSDLDWDYVLAGYGRSSDGRALRNQRDYDFAKHFDIPIKNIFADTDVPKRYADKSGGVKLQDWDF